MIVAVVLFWGSLAALVWTHALYPATVALVGRLYNKCVALDPEYLPSVAVIVTAYNEEGSIERRLDNLRALDYPPELLELVVTSDASTDRTEELAEAAGARVIRNPRGGKVAAQDAAVRATEARGGRLHRCERDLGAGRAAEARPQPRGSGSRVRLRPPAARGPRRLEQGGRVLAVRARDARGRVAARLGHGRQRRRLCAAQVGLRRGRSALRPRPLASLPHGAAWPARGLRAAGAGLRAADAHQRERVPAEGADVRARVADRPARANAARPAPRLPPRASLPPAPPLRERAAAPDPARQLDRAARPRTVYAVFLGLQLGLLAAALAGVGIARYYVLITWATVVALWNYLRRGVPATWAPQREELA